MKREARIDNSVVVEYEFSPERATELANIILGCRFVLRLGVETPRDSDHTTGNVVADLVLNFDGDKETSDIGVPLRGHDVDTVIGDLRFIAFSR